MKTGKRIIALLIAVMLLIPTVISTSANTVVHDGKEYILRSRTPTTGDINVLLVRIGFADYPVDDEDYPADSEEKLLSYFNGGEKSIDGFYENSSYGKLHLRCDKVYAYNALYDRDDYDNEKNPEALSNVNGMMTEALTALSDQINLDDYDSDGDGYLDFVIFDYAGPSGEWGDTWWPHVSYDGEAEIGGKKIETYSLLKGDAVTFIHEFGHILGAPDYYSYEEGNSDAIMTYDKMSFNNGDHNGFTKWSYGWFDDEDIVFADKASGDMTITLTPIESQIPGKKIAVVSPSIDRSNGFMDEYFLVEYDSGEGNNKEVFDKYSSMQPGFRIFHVNADVSFDDEEASVDYNKLNNYLRDNLIHNVKLELDEPYVWTQKDCLYREGDELTPLTSPNTGLYDDGVYNGRYTGISFTDFVTGDQPSFKVSFSDDPLPEVQVNFEVDDEEMRSDASLTLTSDTLISLRRLMSREEQEQYSPYLLADNGDKLKLHIEGTDKANEFVLSYREASPSVQPKTNYSLVLPEGLFRANYNQPVPKTRLSVTSADFLPLTHISTVPGNEQTSICSNPFPMSDSSYGILRVPSGVSDSVFHLASYNLNGEELYSLDFEAPDYDRNYNSVYRCEVVGLYDGNFAVILNTYKNNYFVKIDCFGNTLSDVYTVSNEAFAEYELDPLSVDFNRYKNGVYTMLRQNSDNNAALTIDFESEPKLTDGLDFNDYFELDRETYAIRRWIDRRDHLFLYDFDDRQLADIPVTGSYTCVFEENGNVVLIREKNNNPNMDFEFCADTYTKTGELLESKDIGSGDKIIEHSPYTNAVAAPDGYYLEEKDGRCVVSIFDKDWNWRDTFTFHSSADYALIGNCGIIRKENYSQTTGAIADILRFNLGDFEIIDPFKLGDANLDGAVDITDATTIQRYDVSMTELSDTALQLSDVDKDGDVCIIDATWIQRWNLNMKAPEGIGEKFSK
ncbi:MAG: hypothetical protein IJH40_08600 [Ruminococcus sp.]|uniref:dockerin type I domain-containing protein n=1 Tax=Ruminococcus sp. TaxID=41978 RepID=UPI00287365EC|nr:dockerin type I domain-containing protein [Ruminococcus sp.]MBQ3285685.1 hypothetical protein [Ruminococcus sp.]